MSIDIDLHDVVEVKIECEESQFATGSDWIELEIKTSKGIARVTMFIRDKAYSKLLRSKFVGVVPA